MKAIKNLIISENALNYLFQKPSKICHKAENFIRLKSKAKMRVKETFKNPIKFFDKVVKPLK